MNYLMNDLKGVNYVRMCFRKANKYFYIFQTGQKALSQRNVLSGYKPIYLWQLC